MFTSSLKFYENTSFDDLFRIVGNWEKLREIYFSDAWVMEHEKKLKKTGTFYMRELLHELSICNADILYDFKGNISIECPPYSVKIDEKSFTRDIPYYYTAVYLENIQFKIQGEISFKIGALDTDSRTKIARSEPFQLPFTDKYFLRYAIGCCIVFEDSQTLSKIIKVQKFWRKYLRLKRYIKSKEFNEWFGSAWPKA